MYMWKCVKLRLLNVVTNRPITYILYTEKAMRQFSFFSFLVSHYRWEKKKKNKQIANCNTHAHRFLWKYCKQHKEHYLNDSRRSYHKYWKKKCLSIDFKQNILLTYVMENYLYTTNCHDLNTHTHTTPEKRVECFQTFSINYILIALFASAATTAEAVAAATASIAEHFYGIFNYMQHIICLFPFSVVESDFWL